MNTRRIITYYGIFGCWAKLIPGPTGHILFGIWLAMVLFWTLINAGGVVMFLLEKGKVNKEAVKTLSPDDMKNWYTYNLMALCNYLICQEFLVGLIFALTSVLFMFITEKQIKEVNKK